jgi:transcriptional regulator with XRE-family HTH domain
MRYHPAMRKVPKPKAPAGGFIQDDWYLVDWMNTLKMRQADLMRATGMPKATVSAIVKGNTNYYREIVNKIADALNIKPYELLLHPDDAMAIRRLRSSAMQIASVQLAADQQHDFIPFPAPRKAAGERD